MIFSHHAQIACRLLKYEALAKIRSLFNDLPTLFFMKVLYVITGVGLAVILATIAHILTEPDGAVSANEPRQCRMGLSKAIRAFCRRS